MTQTLLINKQSATQSSTLNATTTTFGSVN